MSAVKFCLWIVLTITTAQAYVHLGCIQNLPSFVDQGTHSPSLLVGIQALVPMYQFSCHGKVTRWGIATERQGKHSIGLQVWRATSRYGSYVYSLVGMNKFDVQPSKIQGLYYITPPAMDQITVQPGDMIGFYLQNNVTIEDDFTIQYKPHANNVTLQFVMTDEPLTIIEETTLSIQMLKTAPIITVDIESFTSINFPKTITPSGISMTSSPIHHYISTKSHISITSEYKYSTQSHEFNSTSISTSAAVPTAAILLVALGILTIAVVLGIIGVVIVCKKNQFLNTNDERLGQRTKLTQKGTNKQNMKICLPEPLLKENPAYCQGIMLQTSNSNQAHEYETPIVFQAEGNYIMIGSHEYDVPRKLHRCKSHDYEEV